MPAHDRWYSSARVELRLKIIYIEIVKITFSERVGKRVSFLKKLIFFSTASAAIVECSFSAMCAVAGKNLFTSA